MKQMDAVLSALISQHNSASVLKNAATILGYLETIDASLR